MRASRAFVTLAAGLVAAAGLAGCGPLPWSGDGIARDLAERIAIGIGDDLTPQSPWPLDAEQLAQQAIAHPRLPDEPAVAYDIETLDWEGNSGDEDGARIRLRIAAEVAEHRSGPWSPARPAGSATRCWTLTVRAVPGWRDDSWQLSEFGCPEGAVARIPDPPPLLTMPDGAAERLVAILAAADGGPALVERLVREEFDDPDYSVAADEREGVLVVALGVPRELSCVVAVRDAAGETAQYGGFPRATLQPGETGCSPNLYFFPVTTH